jgi:hypothetical protein
MPALPTRTAIMCKSTPWSNQWESEPTNRLLGDLRDKLGLKYIDINEINLPIEPALHFREAGF